MTRLAAVPDKLTVPADVAPLGAVRLTVRVAPDSISESNAPVIFLAELLVLLVVRAYVVVESVAHVGLLPATAVEMARVPGLPDTDIASIDPIV